MFVTALYLVTLIIAPQLWMPPFIGWRTDYLIYPMIAAAVVFSGRLAELFHFTVHDWLFLALLVWMTLGAVVNGGSEASKEQIFEYARFFILYKLVIAATGSVDRSRQLMSFFVFLVVVLGVEAIQQKLSVDGAGWANQGRGWIDPDVVAAGGAGRSRWIGIFDGPGVFCVLFTIALPFLLIGTGKEQPPWRRSFSAALVLLVLGATYCTGSRGGLLASLAVIGLFMLRSVVSLRVIFAICALAVTVYSVAPAYLTTINDQSNSTQYRVEMWAAGLDMIKENPAFGVGRGNFKSHSGKHGGKRLIAHNSAVEIGGETGLVGLFLWLSLIYVSIKGAVEYWKSTDDTSHKAFCTALVLGVIAYLISAMFVTLEYETFYLMLALCAVTARSTPNAVSFADRDAVKVAALEGVWLIGMQIFVIAYFG
jgi:hypothetical protein